MKDAGRARKGPGRGDALPRGALQARLRTRWQLAYLLRTEGFDRLQVGSSLVVRFTLTEVCPATLPDTQDQVVPLVLRGGDGRGVVTEPRVLPMLTFPASDSSVRDPGYGDTREDVLGGRRHIFGCGRRREV